MTSELMTAVSISFNVILFYVSRDWQRPLLVNRERAQKLEKATTDVQIINPGFGKSETNLSQQVNKIL